MALGLRVVTAEVREGLGFPGLSRLHGKSLPVRCRNPGTETMQTCTTAETWGGLVEIL